MKKRVLSLLLTLCMVCSLLPGVALAASAKATEAADALYELGLFSGTGTDANGKPIYDLDRAPTRQEAIVMLVRLLGKVDEAANGSWSVPFTDVADWAKPYVGYAYTNGLAYGVSDTAFGSGDIVSASQYLTFVLRALGYESGTDFQWDKAWELSDKIGMTNGEYNGTSNFLRGDVAIVSHKALSMTLKNSNTALKDSLQPQNWYTKEHLHCVWYMNENDKYIREYIFDGSEYTFAVLRMTPNSSDKVPFGEKISIDGRNFQIIGFTIQYGTYELNNGKFTKNAESEIAYNAKDGSIGPDEFGLSISRQYPTSDLTFVNADEFSVGLHYGRRIDSVVVPAILSWIENVDVPMSSIEINQIIRAFNNMLDNENAGTEAFLAANEAYLDGVAAQIGGKSSSSYEYQENRYFQNAITYYTNAKNEAARMKNIAQSNSEISSRCDELITNFDSILALSDARSVESMQVLLDVTTATMDIENEIVDILESYS